MKKKTVGIFVCMLLIFATIIAVADNVKNNEKIVTNIDEKYKWEQLPDTSWLGIDVRCDRNDGTPRILADDFKCISPGPIIDVHLWGSWKYDEGQMKMIHLSIHEDIPADESPTGYSMPGELLWEADFYEFNESFYYYQPDGEWWWDPYTAGSLEVNHYNIWQYDILIPETEAFLQTGTPDNPMIYWLDVWVETEYGEFGWKTSVDQWNDDSVHWMGEDPPWWENKYPPEHPQHGESLDLAFAITTKEEEPECCLAITGVDGGLLDPAKSKEVYVNITNIGTATCYNVSWDISFTGGIILKGPASGTLTDIPPGVTKKATSKRVLGLAIPGILPSVVEVKVDCPNNVCGPQTATRNALVFLLLLKLS